MNNIYLKRYSTKKCYFPDYQLNKYVNLIVVIPCYNEPDLIKSLQALNECIVNFPVEVISVINASERDSQTVKQQNLESYRQGMLWAEQNKHEHINHHFILENSLPAKHAGVGLARKIGMDEAVRMFDSIDNHKGIILCFDADCTCTPNLLFEVDDHFKKLSKSPACSIHFEHPLEGAESQQVYDGVLNYELHLRYYVNALKYSEFPYAHQTIGSSMAVRSSAYQKQGGMNRRKAGEDFYFLNKLMPLGNFTELNSAMVIPSPRKSDRVPFGTGRAIGEWLSSENDQYFTYSPETFKDLRTFLYKSKDWRNVEGTSKLQKEFSTLPRSIQEFVTEQIFVSQLKEINRQSTNEIVYEKRFHQWWDGFKVLKFVHFSRDNFYDNILLMKAIEWLLEEFGLSNKDANLKEMLLQLRIYDKTTEQ